MWIIINSLTSLPYYHTLNILSLHPESRSRTVRPKLESLGGGGGICGLSLTPSLPYYHTLNVLSLHPESRSRESPM